MASTTKSPGRRKRSPVNVHDIGNVGRMTGVTLKPRVRDIHGLETTDGLFSPTPGKPATKKSAARQSNGTSVSSGSMEVAESSAPEPTEVLSSRKLARDGKSILPLPVSRSPIKTNLGTPRRGSSVGALSSTMARSALRYVTQPPVSTKRKLDFSGADPHVSPYSARESPKSSRSHVKKSATRPSAGDVFELPHSSPVRYMSDGELDGVEYADDGLPNGVEEEDYDNGPILEDEPHYSDEAEYEVDAGNQFAVEEAYALPGEDRRASGRPRTSGSRRSESSRISDSQAVDEIDNVEAGEMSEEPSHSLASAIDKPGKRRGRPPKPKNERSTLAPKDVNAKLKGKKQTKPIVNDGFKQPYQPMPAQRMRHQTPMEEDGVFRTRSGRNVYKPLDFWKGERAIFEERVRDPSLQEIIRIDEVTPVKRPRATSQRAASKKRNHSVFEEDVDDDGQEPWENQDGVIWAPVRMWDSAQMVALHGDEEDRLIAWASATMQPRANPDNPNFLFSKSINLPFFGAGVIEIPQGGMKGLKNSRTYQFIFYVTLGKVAVEVAGTRFIISKGGMWQVPRGNFYSITNESDHTAKIFFAQSREISVNEQSPPSLPVE